MAVNKKRKVIKGLAVSALAMLPCFVMSANQDASNRHLIYDGHEVAPQSILVKYKQNAKNTNVHALNAKIAAKQKKKFKFTGVQVLEIPGKDIHSLKAAINRLNNSPFVEYAEPDYIVRLEGLPADPEINNLWGLHNRGQTNGIPDADIDAHEAWDITTGGGSGVIMVVNSGVDYTHPDLAPNMWVNPGEIPDNGVDDDGNGYVDDVHGINAIIEGFYPGEGDPRAGDPMDYRSHGTHVAGTIGAVGNNGIGVAGVNWNTQIMGCKVIDFFGNGLTSNAILCLEYAIKMRNDYGIDIRVTNHSWSGPGYSETLYDTIEASNEAGILLVASAGNADSTDIPNNNDGETPRYPASYDLPAIISVAATINNDELYFASNYGEVSVDLAAPGASILSTMPGNSYGYKSGTSMAAPHVSGAAMLLWHQFPDYSPVEIKDRLESTVDLLPGLSGKVATGGRLNLNNALSIAPSGITLTSEHFEAMAMQKKVITAYFEDVYERSTENVVIEASFNNYNATVLLRDDGIAPDVTADDNIYSVNWVPNYGGPDTITFNVNYLGQSYSTHVPVDVLAFSVYEAIDTEPYNWVDISATGTALGINEVSPTFVRFSLPFPVAFYNQYYDSITVTAFGGIHFDEEVSGRYIEFPKYAQQIPYPSDLDSDQFLALFWDYLSPYHSYWEVQGVSPDRMLIIQYESVSHGAYPVYAPEVASFQVVFYENSTDILMQYKDVNFGEPQYDNGASATVGLQRNSFVGQQYSYNEPVLQDQMAIRWIKKDARNYMIAAGGTHSCALDDNGVNCWGSDSKGQSPAPTGLIRPRYIATGYDNSCALDDSATGITCWGSNADDKNTPPTLVNPTQVSLGSKHSCALGDTGVRCWGSPENNRTNVPAGLVNPKQVVAGLERTCAVDDTDVHCWGGFNSWEENDVPPTLVNPRQVSVGEYHTCALDDSVEGIQCWGMKYFGFRDHPSDLVNPRQLSGGDKNTCVLDDNGVHCWGWDYFIGDTVPDDLINPYHVSVGKDHTCVLDESEIGVQCWGSNQWGKSTEPDSLSFFSP